MCGVEPFAGPPLDEFPDDVGDFGVVGGQVRRDLPLAEVADGLNPLHVGAERFHHLEENYAEAIHVTLEKRKVNVFNGKLRVDEDDSSLFMIKLHS